MRKLMLIAGISVVSALFVSCGFFESRTAVLWTDRPEFAVYADYFNAAQNQYKIETRYLPSPAQALSKAVPGEFPDIVVGSWLKSASTRSLFASLDSMFRNGNIQESSFYPALLAPGRIEGKQYLLPVSFNIPAVIFSRENSGLVDNPFVLSISEIQELGKAYNIERNGVYSRMGFSPSWNDEFLYVLADLLKANFREGSPLAWDPAALEQAVAYIQNWIQNANTSIQAEDDFVFKYFFDPPAKLATSGRILFGYMKSSNLFTLPEEVRSNLDFRWVSNRNTIPLAEGTVYYGIHKKSKSKGAARAFAQWFFTEETQRFILESSRKNRMNENYFGVGNGFSALRTVTEQIYPQFYPLLLGHMPPQDYLTPPNILPRDWLTLKDRVILPYLNDRIRSDSPASIRSLERRIGEWYRLNPVR
ncbi:ABC transporter substrate-binding protein [Breznakiella homolactica]|uniref:Carbohydrate ABC transporter substrate-binding protein n=1 Tax=Breznakiella homolactica TaxID=2798577 RepID=A0A7T8BB78_9SPIR|nr:ABC transporter substrate-binding protein [Breznakiella homolactica]QQO08958.1 ABC transporter substrate-binding protein [Breznakiella homolactica]